MADELDGFRDWHEYRLLPEAEMRQRAEAFAADLHRRRSIRNFSSAGVAPEIIEACVRAAASAPSGANRQPWQQLRVIEDAEPLRLVGPHWSSPGSGGCGAP